MNTGRGTGSMRIRSIDTSHAMRLYKLVVRDKNGKVVQIHESYKSGMLVHIIEATKAGHSVTVTGL